MPSSYTIDGNLGVVFTRGWGDVESQDLVAHYLAMAGDPEFDPGFHQLGDLRDVTSLNATAQQLRDAARLVVFSPESRRAFVAPADHIYGMARMYELVSSCEAAQNVAVFRTLDEAREWLGIGTAV